MTPVKPPPRRTRDVAACLKGRRDAPCEDEPQRLALEITEASLKETAGPPGDDTPA